MSYFIDPVGEDRRLFLSYEGKTPAVALPCHRSISEAHAVRTANAAFGQSGPSSRQGNHSRASVRFHTTANIRG
jgi:hypothetical protein